MIPFFSPSSTPAKTATATPDFDDPLRWPATTTLLRFVIGCMVLGPAAHLVLIVMLDQHWHHVWLNSLLPMGLGLVSLALIASGKRELAARIMLFGTWCIVMFIAVTTGGVRTPVLIMLPVLIIFSGWMDGARAAWMLATLSILAGFALAWAEAEALLAPQIRPAYVQWILQAVAYFMAAGTILFFLRIYKVRLNEVVQLNGRMRQLEVEARYSHALKESERRFHDFSIASSDWFWETDADSRLSFVSPPSPEHGELDWQHHQGRTLGELVRESGEAGEMAREHLASLIRMRQPFREIEFLDRMPSGGSHWVAISGVPVFEAGSRFVGYRGIGKNIQQRKEAELRLAEARATAEAANRAKSEFLSSMSHELRTPLNVILGYAELMFTDKRLPAGQVEAAGDIHRAGSLLLNLVNDVLDLSNIESGRLALNMALQPAGCGNAEALRLVASAAEAAGVTVTDRLGDGIGALLWIDRLRLVQVLTNLLSNAIKYNRPGGKVELSCRLHDRSVRLEVLDDGLGIPGELQGRLFSPFDRLGRENSCIPGTGIGLVIVRYIVESMQGQVGYTSAEGRGSRFWVEFPLAAATDGQA